MVYPKHRQWNFNVLLLPWWSACRNRCSWCTAVTVTFSKVGVNAPESLSLPWKKKNSRNLLYYWSLASPARAGYVREATRFKATHDTVDVPSRDQQVIDSAVASAIALHLPQTIARAVFTTILNASVSFELCVVIDFYYYYYVWLCLLTVPLFSLIPSSRSLMTFCNRL